MNRKKILITGLIVAVLSAVAGYFIFAEKSEKLPSPVDLYTAGDESVESITEAVENVGEEILLSISTSEDKEEEEKNESGDAGAKSDADTAENDEKKLDHEQNIKDSKDFQPENTEMTQQSQDQRPWSRYYYKISVDSIEDIQQYTEFLIENDFEKIEPEIEEPQEKEDTKNNQQLKQEPEKSNISGMYQRDAKEEGYLFCIEIEFPLADDPETGLYKIEATIQEKVEPKKFEAMTRQSAMDYMESIDYKALGLDQPLSNYYVVLDMGRSYIDGKDCYGINVYTKGISGESYFVKKYYLALEDKNIYVYDNDGVIEKLDQESGYFKGIDSSMTMNGVKENDASLEKGKPYHDWNFGPLDSE